MTWVEKARILHRLIGCEGMRQLLTAPNGGDAGAQDATSTEFARPVPTPSEGPET